MKPPLLITGATGGVGASVCRHLAGRYTLLASGRDGRALASLREAVPGMRTYLADLAHPDQVERLLDDVLEEHEFVPYLVNNAGVMMRHELAELPVHAFETSLQVNVLAPFRAMRRLLPEMVRRNFGRIVNITSGAPLNCAAGFSAYSASKAALNALTVTAAREHFAQDIRINLMSPGPVRSGMAPSAPMDPAVCHPTLDYLLSLPADGPTGRFFWLGRELPLFPDLHGVQWLEGTATERFPAVLP